MAFHQIVTSLALDMTLSDSESSLKTPPISLPSSTASSPPSIDNESFSPSLATDVDACVPRSDTSTTLDTEKDSPSPSATFRPVPSPPAAALVVIPRKSRRGMLADLCLLHEVSCSYDYGAWTKWVLTVIVALAASAGTMASAVSLPVLGTIAHDLNSTPAVTNLIFPMYLLTTAVCPLWWSTLAENIGRRTVYLISFSIFVILSIGCSLTNSIAALMVLRLLSGAGAASVQVVGAGTISDIWRPQSRGRAMGIFYIGPLMGSLLAPTIGGFLSEAFGWRSTMWFLAIYGGFILLVIIFVLPETLARSVPESNKNQAEVRVPVTVMAGDGNLQSISATRSQKNWIVIAGLARQVLIEPLMMLKMVRHPLVAITVFVSAISVSSMVMLELAISIVFAGPVYKYSDTVVGFFYLPATLGYVLAAVFGGPWIDRIMAREASRARRCDNLGHLLYLPEDRLRENAYIALIVYPASMIGFAWTAQTGRHWFIPSLFLFTAGFTAMLMFSCTATMLTEFMRKRSSAGAAINNFVRFSLACAAGAVATPLFSAFSFGPVFSVIGIFIFVTGWISVWFMARYGPAWREVMDLRLKQ